MALGSVLCYNQLRQGNKLLKRDVTRRMKMFRRLLPVVCITLMTVVISLILYNEMTYHEEEKAWQELSSTGKTTVERIQAKFQDEIVKLHLVESIMKDNGEALPLDVIQPTTMFARIDVLYPDGSIVSNEKTIRTGKDIDFDAVAAKGEYMTRRKTDFLTGDECVYYVLPVMQGEQVQAVLIGMINTSALTSAFQPLIYNGQADIQIIDTKDGNYIMDSWHDTLGNAYAHGQRARTKEHEDFDMQLALRQQMTGTVAFTSETTGEKLYMYLTPIGMFDWQLSIFAREHVLFSNLMNMQRMFVIAGVTEVLLMALYFSWNIRTVLLLERSLAENEQQKEALRLLSYQDGLTLLFNRNKYTELERQFAGSSLQHTGVAYIDLNGLKQINDQQSHGAGDEYIRRTALILSDFFAGQCYRLGGDEFLVVAPNVEQEDFEERMTEMQQRMARERISVSVGSVWKEESATLKELLDMAEKQMYQEKAAYYQVHDRRRK